MPLTFAAKSLLLFGLSLLFLTLLTLFESSISGLPILIEKVISMIFLVLPGIIGVILGVTSLARKESKPELAALGILLNGLFALFHVFVISFAG